MWLTVVAKNYEGVCCIQIVAMETELKKAGRLNSVQDVKEFWNDMLAPPVPMVTEKKPSFKHCKYSYKYMHKQLL